MPEYENRSITPQELRTAIKLHLRRLIRGLTEMDNNVPESVIDVSSALRQLVTGGKGNRLVQRLVDQTSCDSIRFAETDVSVSMTSRSSIRFEFGAVPVQPTEHANHDGHTLEELLRQKCLRILSPARNEEAIYTWEALITTIANKLSGCHTDNQRRKILDDLACYMVGGVPILRYAIRTIGSAIAHFSVIQTCLDSEIERSQIPPIIPLNSAEVYVVQVFGGIDEKKLEIIAKIRYKAGKAQDLVSWTNNGDPEWLFTPPLANSDQFILKTTIKAGRNEPCPCGSGIKYKRCCGR